jgi:hypothetical protein
MGSCELSANVIVSLFGVIRVLLLRGITTDAETRSGESIITPMIAKTAIVLLVCRNTEITS